MKKVLPIVLSAIIACIAAATLTACYIGNGGNSRHTHNYVWVDSGNGTHKQHCAVDGCNEPDINVGSHTFSADGKCVCGAEKPAEHKHAYTEEVIESKYLKTAATCETKAVYFYSCECGEKGTETFEYGDKLPHTFDKQVVSELYIKSSATCAKKAEYYYSCACGEKGTETFEYGDRLPHTFDKQVVSKFYIKSSATCMTKAEYYYSCECGEKGTETFVDENGEFSTEVHPYEDVWYNDEQFHYHKSSCSHAVVKDKTAHSFGENETCTVCGCRKTSTGLRFTYNSNYNGYILTGIGTCKDLDIIVPSAYNEKPVVGIGGNAFSNSSITSITIPDSVTSIGSEAFFRCSSLTSIVIPDSVIEIGEGAFRGCSSLESITLPFIGASKTAENDYEQVFGYIFGYVTVNNQTYYDGATFQYGYYIFNHYGPNYYGTCYHYWIPNSLKTVVITNVTKINNYAFNNCSKLTSITLPGGLKEIEHNAFSNCTSLKNITIPDGVTSIGYSVFSGCSSLMNIVIPDSVAEIGSDAFSDCNALIYNEYGNGCYLGNDKNNCVVFVKSKSKNITSCSINEKCKIIGYDAFSGCSGLTSITIPDSITYIGSSAFSECSKLTSVYYTGTIDQWVQIDFNSFQATPLYYAKNLYINNGLVTEANITAATKINNYAFCNYSNLTSVTIGNNVTSIGSSAFEGCSGLTSIKIPDSVTSIDNYAFRSCTGLAGITIPDSVTSIGKKAFYNCSSLTNVTIGNSVTSIDDYAFQDCTGLTSITIPDSVTSIGNGAFSGCNSLTSVVWNAANCTKAGSNDYLNYLIFYKCSQLSTITIGDNVKTIPIDAFSNCSGITSVVWNAENCTSAGSNSYTIFGSCSQLTAVTIGDNVKSIPAYAFSGCSKLTSVYYTGTIDKWVQIDF